ncbi:MAG: gamma-glutamylcyclotransferase, partial [Pontibacterium sp.]
KDVDCLDAFEGIGMCYDSKPVEVVVQPENRVVQAYTYFAIHIDPSLKPYHWYKHHIVQGAKEAELPVEYVADIGHVPSIDDPDGDRHQREMMIYSLAPR